MDHAGSSVYASASSEIFCVHFTIHNSSGISLKLCKWLAMAEIWPPYSFGSPSVHPSSYGFHSFRRSAVSWAADHNVPLQNLQAHGSWASSAIHSHLKYTPKASS